MYTHNQMDGARMWMPTVDHVGERCTWEMEVTVDSSFLVIASGELLEQVHIRNSARGGTELTNLAQWGAR